MADKVDYNDIVRMIQAAADKIRTHRDELSKLDTAIGDGDHGITISRAMDIVEKIIRETDTQEIKSLLKALGWGIMGVDGGATGPLLGSFFMGLNMGIEETEKLDCSKLAAMLDAGLAKVQKQTKAQVGDKTIMDALIPAVKT